MRISEGNKISTGKKKIITAYDFDYKNDLHAIGYSSGDIKILETK